MRYRGCISLWLLVYIIFCLHKVYALVNPITIISRVIPLKNRLYAIKPLKWSPGDTRGFHNKSNKQEDSIIDKQKNDLIVPSSSIEATSTLHPIVVQPSIPDNPIIIEDIHKPVVDVMAISVTDVIAMSASNNPPKSRTFDPITLISYVGATATQTTLIILFLHLVQFKGLPLIDQLVKKSTNLPIIFPNTAIGLMFAFLSLRSRVFSPLDTSRPKASTEDITLHERLRPWWQPPPLAFPIIWIIIAILRAVSSTIIYQTTNTLLCTPIFALILHLSFSDTWNIINNVEKRLGTSLLSMLFVLASVINVVYQYYQTIPLAGKIIAPSAIWISIATFLVFSIWRLNSQLFDRPLLLPSVEEGPPSKWRIPFTPSVHHTSVHV